MLMVTSFNCFDLGIRLMWIIGQMVLKDVYKLYYTEQLVRKIKSMISGYLNVCLLDENLENVACFLIENNCNANALRREGPSGSGSELVSYLHTPLHMCCSWGLYRTAKTLVSHQAKINAKVRHLSQIGNVCKFSYESTGF